jgi:hypothetical protein
MSFFPTPLQLSFEFSATLFNRTLSIGNKPKTPAYADASTQTDIESKEVTNNPPPKKINDPTWMLENANEKQLVMSMPLENTRQSAIAVSSKNGYKLMCSYSWKKTKTPTIYVPGSPAVFIPYNISKQKGIRLALDSGRHWVDQHAKRVPKHQFEPVFQALTVVNPEVLFNDVDIVVNRSSLMMLVRFLRNQSSQAFHLDLDIVQNTLFLGRKVKNAMVESTEGSYGRTFENHFTAEDAQLQDADGHHRILQYNFGGLNMVVRVETDAYIPNTQMLMGCRPDDLQESLSANGICHQSPQPTTVIAKGTMVSHASTIEIKSNDSSRPLEQMWFGRTPYCCLGKQKQGFFTRAEVKYVTHEDFEEWEGKQQEVLQKLVWLLQELRTVVKEKSREGSAVLVSLGKGEPIEVYETKTRVGALPQEIVERFWT